MSDRINFWRTLDYHDPAFVLRELRRAERELPSKAAEQGFTLDPRSLRLRTGGLKPHREWRDAALFSYGMGRLIKARLWFAPHEAADYDFVTCWTSDDQAHFRPVQLKELPPADLNARLTLTQLVDSLRRYAPAPDTTLVIKLSRKPEGDWLGTRLPDSPFGEVYFFWGTKPHSESFAILGDLKQSPLLFPFDYPAV